MYANCPSPQQDSASSPTRFDDSNHTMYADRTSSEFCDVVPTQPKQTKPGEVDEDTKSAPIITTPSTNPKKYVFKIDRFPPQHPRRRAPEYETREMLRLNPLYLFYTGLLPPFIGAVASIATALYFHNDEISNYNWQCGVSSHFFHLRVSFKSISVYICILAFSLSFFSFLVSFKIITVNLLACPSSIPIQNH